MDKFTLCRLPSAKDNCDSIESGFSTRVDKDQTGTTLTSCARDGVQSCFSLKEGLALIRIKSLQWNKY